MKGFMTMQKRMKTVGFRILPELTRKFSLRFHLRNNLLTLNHKNNKYVFRKYLLT